MYVRLLVAASCLMAVGSLPGIAAAGTAEEQIAEAAAQNKFAFIMFWRQDDAATRAMQQTLEREIDARADRATLLRVRITDRTQAALVQRFDATRSPMPTVVALAPNGAVTGMIPAAITPEQIDSAIISPGFATCIKAMQDRKIVLLCVQPTAGAAIPEGVQQFVSDPHYTGRTQIVSLTADDDTELNFFQQVKVDPRSTTASIVFMAPPGTHLGTFDASVTSETLVSTLLAAGKCCPDCKRQQQSRQARKKRRRRR